MHDYNQNYGEPSLGFTQECGVVYIIIIITYGFNVGPCRVSYGSHALRTGYRIHVGGA